MKTIKIKIIKDLPSSYFKNNTIPAKIENKVERILHEVKKDGDNALIKLTSSIDNIKLTKNSLKISEKNLLSAWQELPSNIKQSLNAARKSIHKYHLKQFPEKWKIKTKNSSILEQLYKPIENLGIYIPGGTAPLMSTVLMTAIPAKLAGVKNIFLVSPPKINKYILASAYKADVSQIFQIGGAQAIGALAYGTRTIPKVDKIVGPGNIYVTSAKQQVFGTVDIDMLAGPSEVLIIADSSANAEFITADLLSQLEHDTLSRAILVTTSEKIFKDTQNKLTNQVKRLSRQKILKESIKKGLWIIKVPSLSKAIEVSNVTAPEHLELMIKKPKQILKKINHAGLILIGPYTPVSVSDFIAGTNHVLPTGGTARFFSGLGVTDFLRPVSTVKYTKKDLLKIRKHAKTIGQIEKLDGHINSINIRQ